MTKTDFLNKLDKDKVCGDIITNLHNSNLPLVLWGCGDVADAVYQYLYLNHITISQVWVDGYTKAKRFHGFEPRNIHEILETYDEFDVILGHSHYEKGEQVKRQYPQIKHVYYAFSVHYEQYEKVPYEALEEKAERYAHLYNRLADEKSQSNLMLYLNTKLTGNAQYIIDAYSDEMGFFDNDVYSLSDHETFLDIGAYDGDTARDFLNTTNGKYKKIIMLEPDVKNYVALNHFLASKHLRNVIPSMMGAWNCVEELVFNTGNEQISSVEVEQPILKDSDKMTIFAAPVDDVFGMEEISLIKINYFTGVLEALEGCEAVIRRNHPKIAVCVGFDIYNVLKISEYIFSLELDYQVYLRFNRAMSSTFTLYAVAGGGNGRDSQKEVIGESKL